MTNLTQREKMFKNTFVVVSYFSREGERPYIIVRDITDSYNEPTAYTRKVRGIGRAWEFITKVFNKEGLREDLKFRDIVNILDDKFNLNTHHYCAID